MSQPRIVVFADDDDDIRLCACAMLRDEGFDVREARDGAEALARLDALGDAHCILVLDLMMPRVSGYDVLARLAREGRLGALPVIVCSAFDGESASSLGVRWFVRKPLDVDRLVGALIEASGTPRSEVRLIRRQSSPPASPEEPFEDSAEDGEGAGLPPCALKVFG
jgi:two-component system response regulator (stage 0 sporulation protein F)